MLLVIQIEDGRTILLPRIRTLAIDLSWVMSAPEYLEQFVVARSGRIKRDLDRLRASHITRNDRGHTRRLFKNFLRAPETSTGEIGYV